MLSLVDLVIRWAGEQPMLAYLAGPAIDFAVTHYAVVMPLSVAATAVLLIACVKVGPRVAHIYDELGSMLPSERVVKMLEARLAVRS
jgi:hypothetical protein